ncbi:MAG: hypothetical protein L6R40_001635 [Gallowayella cf. fulva]|nr:MAG: hypothetical protein L6R40_001635 [Xanthomendoza cf. fulva]
MSSSIRSDVSPGPQIRETPGAFPSTPGEPDSPAVVSSQSSLSQAVYERRTEYTVPQKIRIKVGSWNVAALSGTEKDIGSWFVDGKGISESLSVLSFGEDDKAADAEDVEDVGHQEARRSKKKPTVPLNDHGLVPGGDDVGLYVLGLQEIIDVSSATEALRPYNDPWPGRRWKQAVQDALPDGYVKVAEQQLVGLFLVIFAAPKVAPTISSVSTTSVGTGLMGYMGNKGAVTSRIVLGETTRLVFINCHLAAGVESGSLDRRNWDAAQVLKRTRFGPLYNGAGEREDSGESIGDEDFAFWFGDLNYRLEGIPGDDVRRLLMLHTRNEYRQGQKSRRKIDMELAVHDRLSHDHCTDTDSTSQASSHSHARSSTDTAATSLASEMLDPASDPASLQTTLASLLPHDQLHQQMQKRKAFYDGWREGPIDFLPTYKYDVGSVGMYDSSEKKRGPSWCDRILYRTRRDKQAHEDRIRAEEAAKKRDQEMKFHGVDDSAINEEVLFDYDPANDGDDPGYDPDADAEDPEEVTTAAGFHDKINLEYYTSHQRVLSSDHKPLDAIFTLHYEAVDPDLKAKVHQEVARELDKAENEGRPAVTVVVDHHHDHNGASQTSPSHEGVDFGDVCFDSPKTHTITIANTGRVPATVGFTDRIVVADQAAGAAPPWLRIRFDRASNRDRPPSESHDVYTLEPGDAANVELTVHVKDIPLVRSLNEKKSTLDDVLVLRIHNGRDHFLPIHATWLPSSFGRSVGNLVKLPEGGVRKSQDGHDESHGVKWSAPREIFRLTESIEDLVERAVAEFGMKAVAEKAPWEEKVGWPFITPADEGKEKQKLKERVREALDHDQPISNAFSVETAAIERVEAVAETLLTFLTALEDGVISERLWNDLEAHMVENGKSKKSPSPEEERLRILDILTMSPAHSTSFTFVVSMLVKLIQEIVAAAATTTEDASRASLRKKLEEIYASTFSDIVIRTPLSLNGKERRASLGRRRRVLEMFIRADL